MTKSPSDTYITFESIIRRHCWIRSPSSWQNIYDSYTSNGHHNEILLDFICAHADTLITSHTHMHAYAEIRSSAAIVAHTHQRTNCKRIVVISSPAEFHHVQLDYNYYYCYCDYSLVAWLVLFRSRSPPSLEARSGRMYDESPYETCVQVTYRWHLLQGMWEVLRATFNHMHDHALHIARKAKSHRTVLTHTNAAQTARTLTTTLNRSIYE